MKYRLALCSEVFQTPIEETIESIARIGFDGIEIAPFNVAPSVDDVPTARRKEIAARARDAGIEIVGLHWLLVSPEGLHLTTADDATRERTVRYLQSLAGFCGDLGGRVMILGSPKQRDLEDGTSPEQAFDRAREGLRRVGEACGDSGVELLLEPLHPRETTFLQNVEEALELARSIDHPSVGYMLDCKAMSGFPDGIEGTIRKYLSGAGHLHTNQPDGRGPGMGDLDFGPIFDGRSVDRLFALGLVRAVRLLARLGNRRSRGHRYAAFGFELKFSTRFVRSSDSRSPRGSTRAKAGTLVRLTGFSELLQYATSAS